MPEFRIAHLSDFHFSTREGHENPLEDLSSKVERIKYCLTHPFPKTFFQSSHQENLSNSLPRRLWEDEDGFDAIIITGDLAASGIGNNLLVAYKYISDPSVPGQLKIPNPFHSIPTVILPGNHDRYTLSLNCPPLQPGGNLFDRIFQAYWPVALGKVQEYAFDYGNPDDSVSIIRVDFSLNNAADVDNNTEKIFGCGRVHEDTLKTLKEKTEALMREENPPLVIWAIHFAPDFPHKLADMELLNDEELLGVANKCGVPLILCGHTHKPDEYISKHSKKTQVICVGTATSVSKFTDGQSFSIVSFNYDAGNITDEVSVSRITPDINNGYVGQ